MTQQQLVKKEPSYMTVDHVQYIPKGYRLVSEMDEEKKRQWLHSEKKEQKKENNNKEREVYEIRTMATRCNIKVNGKEIEAIIDTGAGPNVISKRMMEKLRMEIKNENTSNGIIIGIEGKGMAALGKIQIIIQIEGLFMPVKLQVIDSKRNILILGNNILGKLNANINYGEKILTIEKENEVRKVPIWHNRNEESETESEDDNENESNEESENEYEEEYDEDEKFEMYFIENEEFEKEFEENLKIG